MVVNLLTYGTFLTLQILGMGFFVSAFTGLDPVITTIIGGLIVVIYTSIGGLHADIRTDIFQFLVMFGLLIIFLPFVIGSVGGFGALSELPPEFLNGIGYLPWYVYVVGFLFVGAGVITSMDIWQRAYAGDTSLNVKKSFYIAGVFMLLFLVMGTLLGVFGKLVLPAANPNLLIPELIQTLIPMGLYGIVMAGFFAAIMSSADSVLIILSMTLVHDFYRKTLGRELSEKRILHTSRIITLVLGILAVSIALLVFDIVHLAIESMSLWVVLLPAVVFGFYWEQANERAAFWSIVFGLLTLIGFSFIDPLQAFIPGVIVGFLVFFVVQLFSYLPLNASIP